MKEQLKKIGGMEFYDVHFSYIDQETLEEKFISVPEQGGGALIPAGPLNPGVIHTVATAAVVTWGCIVWKRRSRRERRVKTSGLGSNTAAREAIKVGFDYFKANATAGQCLGQSWRPRLPPARRRTAQTGPTTAMTLAAFVALCSGVLGKPLQSQTGGPGKHEPGWQPDPGREPGRVPPGGLRRRCQAAAPADGKCEGPPDDSR